MAAGLLEELVFVSASVEMGKRAAGPEIAIWSAHKKKSESFEQQIIRKEMPLFDS